ncbi:MAG: hypothetical protein OEZ16_12940 [Chromatiales bacterium]|nr:hypothetical protein [Chromatiales bacterium]
MDNKIDAELKAVKKQIIKYQLMGAPGALFLGIGLYGLFIPDSGEVFSFLKDRVVVYTIFTSGVVIELWQLYVLFPLFKKQVKLTRERDGKEPF